MSGSLLTGLNTFASVGAAGSYMSFYPANGTAPILATASFYWRFEQNQTGMWSIQDPNSGLFFGYDTSGVLGYSTPIVAVENEVSWDIWPSSTTGNYQLFVHNTFLTPTLFGSEVGSMVYLTNVTNNNNFQTWEILGIGTISAIGPIEPPTGLVPHPQSTTTTHHVPEPATTTHPVPGQATTIHPVPVPATTIHFLSHQPGGRWSSLGPSYN